MTLSRKNQDVNGQLGLKLKAAAVTLLILLQSIINQLSTLFNKTGQFYSKRNTLKSFIYSFKKT